MHTHTQLHKLYQLWPFLVVALLAIVSPAQGQWYQESTIDLSTLKLSGTVESLAINGDTVVIARYTAAYILERTAGQWNQTKSLTLASGNVYVPVQVAMDGDNVAVCSYQSPTSYILHRDAPGSWSSTTLAAPAMDIDLSGDTALLCYKTDWDGNKVGQRIFERQADGSWTQSATLPKPGTSGISFGTSGAISGNRVLIGEEQYAYIFERDSIGAWSSTATLDTRHFAGFGGGIALSGSTAVAGAWPTSLFERAGDGTWTKTSTPGGNSNAAAVDGNDAIVGGLIYRRDAAGGWTESQVLPGRGQPVALGGGKLALTTSNNQIQIYSYDSSPRLFYGNFDAGSNLADLGFAAHTDSYSNVYVSTEGRLALQRMAAGAVGVSKMLDCQDLVTFTFEYDLGDGNLQLSLNGVTLDTISSSVGIAGSYRRTFSLAELGLSPGELRWDVDFTAPSGRTVTIDNLYITTNVPEPATLALLAAGGLAMRRRR